MKKTLLIAALASAALVSCSKDEVVKINQDEIKFSVVADNQTKVGAVATTTSSISEFKVWAYTATASEDLYINGEVYSKTQDGIDWTSIDTKHYWPSEKLNFYAVSPSSNGGTISSNGKAITNYTASGEEDLLYSVKMGVEKTSGVVSLNFRHALSQIVFKAKNNNNSKLGVAVSGVKIVNIYKSNALLTLPSLSTDANLSNDEGITTETDNKWGVWKNDGYSDKVTYAANVTEVSPLTASAKDLTTENQGLLLLPQTLTPWVISGLDSDPDNSEAGSYFLVSCKVWNISGDVTQDADPVYLHGSKDAYAEVAIPTTAITWKQGMKYIYTFIFGDGAGYEPPVDSDTEVTPVLVPIKLSVTVDEFQSATGIDVNM